MYEDVCYKKTYLAEVIARIDFATPIEALQKNVSTKIMAKITKHFPIAEPVEAIGTHFEFGADGGMKKQERAPSNGISSGKIETGSWF